MTIVGFGATTVGGGGISPSLLQAEVPIVDGVCLSFDKDCHTEAAPHGEFIAGGGGIDTCVGDGVGRCMPRSRVKPLCWASRRAACGHQRQTAERVGFTYSLTQYGRGLRRRRD